jgi:oligopeptidase B
MSVTNKPFNEEAAQRIPGDHPPAIKRVPVAHTLHGETRIDEYAWLHERAHPEVLAQLEAENAYTQRMMAPTVPLQAALYAEMLSHIKQTDLGAPYLQQGYYYYARTQEGAQYALHCRRRGTMSSPEEVLLDLNELGADKSFFALGAFAVSDDGNILAYSTDETGYRQYTLQFKDLRDGTIFPERIERVDGVVWCADDRTFVYVTEDAVTKRADRVWRRELGSASSDLLHEERDELFDLGVDRTRDGAFITIRSEAKDTAEVRYLRAERPADAPRLFSARRDGIRYDLDHREGLFYVRTDDGAPDFRVFTTPVDRPERAHWSELIGERPGTTITGLELFRDFIVVAGRRDGLASLEIRRDADPRLVPLTFDEPDYVVRIGQNREYAATALRFDYESLVTPAAVYDLEVATGARTLVKATEVPGYDPQQYRAERFFARAADGTRIPVSLVQRRDSPRDGSAPLLLYAYGSYGVSIDPRFSAGRLPLLDRGVGFAIAHVRGGGEFGEAWRLAGNMSRKRTTFTDFCECAERLIEAGYTAPDRLVIQGGSAGGLLVGAAINMHPELFAAAIAQVPFVDVLTTMLDPSLPLTTVEYREWGDPREKPAYDDIRAYSPVDNVVALPYPTVLIEVAYNDSQVPYWEGVKFAAKLRACTTSARPILVKANMGAGHGGASGRYDALKERAFDYAFVLTSVGIDR